MLDLALNMREIQPTNHKVLKVVLKELVNLPQRSKIKLMKSEPRQGNIVVKARQRST